MGLSGELLDQPYVEKDFVLWIRVPDPDKRTRLQDFDTEFFVDLPCQSPEPVFSGLGLAPGKLPAPSLVNLRSATG